MQLLIPDHVRLCVPSAELFMAFCNYLVRRYRIEDKVYPAKAAELEHIRTEGVQYINILVALNILL